MARTIIRAEFHVPADVWLEHMSDLFEYVRSNCSGDVSTCPGPSAIEVDWFFENSCDAVWFMLKYSGYEVKYKEFGYEREN